MEENIKTQMQASPPAMPNAVQLTLNAIKKLDHARSFIHPRSYRTRCLVSAFGASPFRVPIARWNGCLGLALLPVPLALLLGSLGLPTQSFGLELVPVPFNVLQSAAKKVRKRRTHQWVKKLTQ